MLSINYSGEISVSQYVLHKFTVCMVLSLDYSTALICEQFCYCCKFIVDDPKVKIENSTEM